MDAKEANKVVWPCPRSQPSHVGPTIANTIKYDVKHDNHDPPPTTTTTYATARTCTTLDSWMHVNGLCMNAMVATTQNTGYAPGGDVLGKG